eukprot:CFRG2126T1
MDNTTVNMDNNSVKREYQDQQSQLQQLPLSARKEINLGFDFAEPSNMDFGLGSLTDDLAMQSDQVPFGAASMQSFNGNSNQQPQQQNNGYSPIDNQNGFNVTATTGDHQQYFTSVGQPGQLNQQNQVQGLSENVPSSYGNSIGRRQAQSLPSPRDFYPQAPNHFNPLGLGLGRSMGGTIDEVIDFSYLYSLPTLDRYSGTTGNGASILNSTQSNSLSGKLGVGESDMSPGPSSQNSVNMNNLVSGLSMDVASNQNQALNMEREFGNSDYYVTMESPSSSSAPNPNQRNNSNSSQGGVGIGSVAAVRKRSSKDISSHMVRAVGIVQHTHDMQNHIEKLQPMLQKELLTFKKAIKKATMGDRLQFLHQYREALGKYAPFIAYEPEDKSMKRLKLNTKHFFSLRGGFNEDAKTESAQQAINKLNSLKMFFDQFPSMRIPSTQLRQDAKRVKSDIDIKGTISSAVAAFTKASDQITQQPLQLLIFDITNQEFEQFFPRWDTTETPLEIFASDTVPLVNTADSNGVAIAGGSPPTINASVLTRDVDLRVIRDRLQSGLFSTTSVTIGGLSEIRKSNKDGLVCLPIRPKRPQVVTFRYREVDFERMSKYFDENPCGGVVFLLGMAGVGKTVFAARYLWELFERDRTERKSHYEVTLWMDFDGITDRAACEKIFASMAGANYLGLSDTGNSSAGEESNYHYTIEHTLYPWFFDNKGKWLIVFDNLSAMAAEFVFDLMHPIISSGSLLVTSRWNECVFNGPDKDLVLKIEPVSLDSAVEFLIKRSGITETAAQIQLQDIECVAERLGRLPQALDIVGERLRGSIQTFVEFNKSLKYMNALKGILASKSPTGAQSLLDTYRAICDSVPEGASHELLYIIAYLPSIHIPIAIFTGFEHARHDFPKVVKVAFPETNLFRELEGQPQAIHSIIAPILNSAVISKLPEATGVLGMHPVVQEILRELMKPEECIRFRSAAVELLYSALCVERHSEDGLDSLGMDTLIPHVWDVLSNSSSAQASGMACLGLWCKFGEYVNYMCQYSMVGPAQKADFGTAMTLAKARGIEDAFQDIMLAWVRFKRQRRINSCKDINNVESFIQRNGIVGDVESAPDSHATTSSQPYNTTVDPALDLALPKEIDGKLLSKLQLRPLDQRIVNMVYSKVLVEPVTRPSVVSVSPTACALLGIDGEESLKIEPDKMARLMSGVQMIDGAQPTAHLYCGHQFGNFAGQLGDGRAHSMGRVLSPLAGQTQKGGFDASFGPYVELQFKGTGRTPYSRTADGRAVLRSSIREFLCSEYVAALNIPTARTATLVNSDTQVTRDPLYVGKPVRENASIVSRIAPSFWRVGSFEIFAVGENGVEGPYAGEIERCVNMLDFYIKEHFNRIWKTFPHGKQRYTEFFSEVCARNARTVAQWQSVGFVHGVLNTDNISLLGLTLDYGPFGFMDSFNPHYVSNYSDTDERYSYENQPKMIFWGLGKLAEALSCVVPINELRECLNRVYWPVYVQAFRKIMRKKWGMIGHDTVPTKSDSKLPEAVQVDEVTKLPSTDDHEKLIACMMKTMEETGADFTNTFRCLSNIIAHQDGADSPEAEAVRERVLEYIVSQLDDGREMTKAMPYEIEYLKVLSSFPKAHDDVLLALTGKHIEYFQQRMESVERAKNRAAVSPFQKDDEDRAKWAIWLHTYHVHVHKDYELVKATGQTLEQYNATRVKSMNMINPKFCLRNYMAQSAFEKAKVGDLSELHILTKILSRPFDEWEEYKKLKYDRHASSLRMCISCSS